MKTECQMGGEKMPRMLLFISKKIFPPGAKIFPPGAEIFPLGAKIFPLGSLVILLVGALLTAMGTPADAKDFEVLGNPLAVMGYVNQGLGYGIGGDDFDTMEGWQSFKYDVLLETRYQLDPNLRVFVSGMLSGDFAYDIFSGDDEWDKKGFSDSRDELAHDTVLRDLLNEAHVTWTPGNCFFRVGKQIVVWGETDGFRIMDQINPLDQRRGITDVEFETTVLPIWLVKAEYYLQPDSSWLQDFGVEIIFNPNADFEPNRDIVPGNDVSGIWAPNVEGPFPFADVPGMGPMPYPVYQTLPKPPFPAGLPAIPSSVGSIDAEIDDPDDWDSDYFEFGLRIKTVIHDTLISLNYFYGIDNDPVLINTPDAPRVEVSPYDGRVVIHPGQRGYYPRFRMAGITFTRDFENWNISALGGVGPVLRIEGFYAFDNTFTTSLAAPLDRFETHDEIRYAVGIDWKVKIDWLNHRAYFMISPQFYHRFIADYPSGYHLVGAGGKGVKDHNYQTSLMISTTYFHNKLEPSVFWLNDRTNDSSFIRPQLKYEYSNVWNYTLGAIFFSGENRGAGFEPLEHKEHVYFTVAYRF